jgi:dTDP-4-dehydrorhamnose reductase
MIAFDILIIGGSGFVGSKLVEVALKAGLNTAYTYSNKQLALPATSFQLQIQEGKALETCIAKTQPRCIVYCAVPPPKSDEYLHEVVSVQGLERVCAALKNLEDCRLIYISTNAVFSGQDGPYKESDIPDPEKRHDPYRIYALTRAQGEQVALNSWHNTIIVRTSDVNGKDQAGNLNPRLANLLAQFEAGQGIERSTNALISPTLVDNLAESLLEISRPNFTYRGILHLAGRQQISYFDFACLLAEKVRADKTLLKPEYLKVWNIGLDTSYSQSFLHTPFLNVEEQLSVIFSKG